MYIIIILLAIFSLYTWYVHAEDNTQVISREDGGLTLSATGAQYRPYRFLHDWFTPQP